MVKEINFENGPGVQPGETEAGTGFRPGTGEIIIEDMEKFRRRRLVEISGDEGGPFTITGEIDNFLQLGGNQFLLRRLGKKPFKGIMGGNDMEIYNHYPFTFKEELTGLEGPLGFPIGAVGM